jgi:hypothetical protein
MSLNPDFGISESPWTPQEVDNIDAWQECPYVHPYTCPCDHPETRDHVLLTPTETGLVCSEPDCEYEQSWVHLDTASGKVVEAMQSHPFLDSARRAG